MVRTRKSDTISPVNSILSPTEARHMIREEDVERMSVP